MSFATQVVNEAEIQAEITNQTTVANFKNRLTDLRSFKFECIQRLKNIQATLKKMSEERAYLLSMFDTEAIQMYPELTLDTIGPTLQSVVPSHPLAMLWEQYAAKLESLDASAEGELSSFAVNEKDYIEADTQEVQILEEYAGFASQASTYVPSVEELSLMLESEESIPKVDESSLIADISAINILSPAAADMITREQVDQEEQLAKTEADAAIAAYDRQLENPYNPLGMILAASAVFYALFA